LLVSQSSRYGYPVLASVQVEANLEPVTATNLLHVVDIGADQTPDRGGIDSPWNDVGGLEKIQITMWWLSVFNLDELGVLPFNDDLRP
jgi:hypothetical protein